MIIIELMRIFALNFSIVVFYYTPIWQSIFNWNIYAVYLFVLIINRKFCLIFLITFFRSK